MKLPAQHSGSRPGTLLLNHATNPFAPSQAVHNAIESSELIGFSTERLSLMLRQRLATLHRIHLDRISLAGSASILFDTLLSEIGTGREIAVFPPTGITDLSKLITDGWSIRVVRRSESFRVAMEQLNELPPECIAFVQSPNDPTGTPLQPTTAAHIAGSSRFLIVDERLGGYFERSLVPLSGEFQDIVLIRSFSGWAGLNEIPLAYAISSPSAAERLSHSPGSIPAASLVAALATMSDLDRILAAARQVRVERARLYRMLRKLNLLVPYPSAASFVMARVTRGKRDDIYDELGSRHIAAYRPVQPELSDCLRFSAVSPVATRRLQRALIEIGRAI